MTRTLLFFCLFLLLFILLQCNHVDAITLHMMWTTTAMTIQSRHLLVLNSYLFHHPDWHVKLYIRDPNYRYWSIILEPYLRRGFIINLIEITDEFLKDISETGPCKVAAPWVKNEKWKSGKYFYSHLTDFLRFCLLTREGGVYSDFDAILLRPMPIEKWLSPHPVDGHFMARTVIGKDRVSEPCPWCLSGGRTYLAPGLMIAESGAILLKQALQAFNEDQYDPNSFNSVGPKAVTMASKLVSKHAIIALETELFYPINYKEAGELFNEQADLEGLSRFTNPLILLEIIKRRAISLHFFGAQTKALIIKNDSIIELLRKEYAFENVDDHTGKVIISAPEYHALVTNECNLVNGIRIISNIPKSIYLSLASSSSSSSSSTFSGRLSVNICQGETVAKINSCLSKLQICTNEAYSILTIKSNNNDDEDKDERETSNEIASVAIYNLSNLLTIAVKTMDRMSKVFELVSSAKLYYPNINILVSNDGLEAYSVQAGSKRGFKYMPLPFDTGLSAARNIMLKELTTLLVLLLDDDFVFTRDTDIAYLAHQAISRDIDIVAAKSPADFDQHGIDYSGLIIKKSLTNDKGEQQQQLEIVSGNRGVIVGSSCEIVDIVPNIFVAKIQSLKRIGWDDSLKLGEHEDFFLRAMQNGIQVATCKSVSLIHRQEAHWLNRTAYDRMRGRVWNFLRQALVKHNLDRLLAFGMVTMNLQELRPESIKDIRIYDLQPFSVAFTWNTNDNYHYYMIDIFDITESSDDNDPGHFEFNTLVEPSKSQPITPKAALITNLDPDRYYRIVVKPANHTNVSETGPELIIKTASMNNNLIFNGQFDGNDEWWKRSLASLSALVKLIKSDQRSVNGIPSRKSHFANERLDQANGDYAMSLNIAAGQNQSFESFILQEIPAAELPDECHQWPCQVSISGWTRVDHLYGPPSSLKLQLQLLYWWSDDSKSQFVEDYDPYEQSKWQCLAFSTGLIMSNSPVSLIKLEVRAYLMAPHGSVFFDDLYLAIRPIYTNGYL